MQTANQPIGVLGAGSWGTALAISLSRDGRPAYLWGRDAAQISTIESVKCNIRYLPDYSLPEQLKVTSNISD